MNQRERQKDEEKAKELKLLSAQGIHHALLTEGRWGLDRAPAALAWSGFASGISMGLSLLAQGLLHAHLPDAEWRPLAASIGYSVGFVAVMLGRQQLYTETTLTAFLPFLHERTSRTLARVLRLWFIVLVANLAGGFLFAWAMIHPTVAEPELREAFSAIAHEAADHEPWSAFVRGIFGGWIIALTAWLLPSSGSARIIVVVLATSIISAAQLTHIVAGSIDYFYGIAAGEASWTSYLGRYFLPVLIGNSIGGTVFVAALNHAQVVGGERARS